MSSENRAAERRFPVIEIFGPTVQGEGIVIGVQTMFVRFGGCDYRCTKCDSLHAVLPDLVHKNAVMMTAQEIFDQLNATMQVTGTKWVTFSGGNPAMWDLSELVRLLDDAGYMISVETQGTLNPKWFEHVHVLTVSPKGPGMGEKFEPAKFEAIFNKYKTNPGFAVKIVVMDRRDIEFVKEMDARYNFEQYHCLYLSLGNECPPTVDDDGDKHDQVDIKDLLRDYRIIVEELLAEPSLKHARILPQFHVLLWGNKQGV